jgi:carbon-monoxide dehydrogenase iron sulfur subunit
MIRLDVSKCSGCRRCEVNCSFFHSGKVGRNGSRIKVVKIESRGIDVPVVCQQCQERYCTKCPESAILIGQMGEIMVSPTLCTACGDCESQCPIGAIELFNEIPHVCDLCGGDARCVQECNLGAILFEPTVTEAVRLKDVREKSRGLSPEAKRLRFAEIASQDMRDHWLGMRRK